jgi:hypothetical protein
MPDGASRKRSTFSALNTTGILSGSWIDVERLGEVGTIERHIKKEPQRAETVALICRRRSLRDAAESGGLRRARRVGRAVTAARSLAPFIGRACGQTTDGSIMCRASADRSCLPDAIHKYGLPNGLAPDTNS